MESAVTLFHNRTGCVLLQGSLGTWLIGGLCGPALWLSRFDIACTPCAHWADALYCRKPAAGLWLCCWWRHHRRWVGAGGSRPRYDFMPHAVFVGFVFA
ncbi:MAG: hypothetical protein H6656_11945 [Ardenticatenaceae bacterium]|nr:hypothetical protein [Ardenticatenaceae bacterium]